MPAGACFLPYRVAFYSCLPSLSLACSKLPEAEQVKHADTLFRYLFKVSSLLCWCKLTQPWQMATDTTITPTFAASTLGSPLAGNTDMFAIWVAGVKSGLLFTTSLVQAKLRRTVCMHIASMSAVIISGSAASGATGTVVTMNARTLQLGNTQL